MKLTNIVNIVICLALLAFIGSNLIRLTLFFLHSNSPV